MSEKKEVKPWPEKCPECGGPLSFGYGLMGGGIGPYVLCVDDDCDWMEKRPEELQ